MRRFSHSENSLFTVEFNSYLGKTSVGVDQSVTSPSSFRKRGTRRDKRHEGNNEREIDREPLYSEIHASEPSLQIIHRPTSPTDSPKLPGRTGSICQLCGPR